MFNSENSKEGFGILKIFFLTCLVTVGITLFTMVIGMGWGLSLLIAIIVFTNFLITTVNAYHTVKKLEKLEERITEWIMKTPKQEAKP